MKKSKEIIFPVFVRGDKKQVLETKCRKVANHSCDTRLIPYSFVNT